MPSPQSLSEADRRIVAAWAAGCAEHVLAIFEADSPGDSRARALIARTRAFASGDLGVAEAIRVRFAGGVPASEKHTAAAVAAARAAGQAAGVAHMGAHALGAAGYAAKAAALAAPDRPAAANEEVTWQVDHMDPEVRAALWMLPPVGEDTSGPLGAGLLSSGLVGRAIRDLQSRLAVPDEVRAETPHPLT
jgi:hypothetical protein